jgi:hypothetical protein
MHVSPSDLLDGRVKPIVGCGTFPFQHFIRQRCLAVDLCSLLLPPPPLPLLQRHSLLLLLLQVGVAFTRFQTRFFQGR